MPRRERRDSIDGGVDERIAFPQEAMMLAKQEKESMERQKRKKKKSKRLNEDNERKKNGARR